MNSALIQQFIGGADVPAHAIAGLTPEEMNVRPQDGSWTIRQIIAHLMDSDLIGSDRMKRIISMDNPVLFAYDQEAFARKLFYTEIDASHACQIFSLNRKIMGSILENLATDDFMRTGKHSEEGIVTLGGLVETYVEHLEHHIEFVLKKREMIGNALAI